MSQFVRFMDMHSHGYLKEKFDLCYIECDSTDEAKTIFYNRFGHNPDRVSCPCCGNDYSIDEPMPLKQATAYERGCDSVKISDDPDVWEWQERQCDQAWRPYVTLREYVQRVDVLIIHAFEIKDDERIGDVPDQGYVWLD